MGLFDRFKKEKSEYSYETPEYDEAGKAREDWEKSTREFEEDLERVERKRRVVEEDSEPIEFEYSKSPYDKYETGKVYESGEINFDKATEPDMDDVNKQAYEEARKENAQRHKAYQETEEKQKKEEEKKAKEEFIRDLHQKQDEQNAEADAATFTKAEDDARIRAAKTEFNRAKWAEGVSAAAAEKYTWKGRAKTAFGEMLTGGKRAGTGRTHGLTSAERAIKTVRSVSTLGGAVHMSKARKHLYTPKTDISFYIPSKTRKSSADLYSSRGMQSLNMPAAATHGASSSTLRRAGTPAYDKLRQASTFRRQQATGMQPRVGGIQASPIAKLATGTPSHLAKPMKFVKIGSQANDVAMERLRGLSFPVGLTTTEKLAYAEIKENHDIDTKSHVVSELMNLGVDKLEASRAVEGLMHRKIVKTGKSEFGERTLEIAK